MLKANRMYRITEHFAVCTRQHNSQSLTTNINFSSQNNFNPIRRTIRGLLHQSNDKTLELWTLALNQTREWNMIESINCKKLKRTVLIKFNYVISYQIFFIWSGLIQFFYFLFHAYVCFEFLKNTELNRFMVQLKSNHFHKIVCNQFGFFFFLKMNRISFWFGLNFLFTLLYGSIFLKTVGLSDYAHFDFEAVWFSSDILHIQLIW